MKNLVQLGERRRRLNLPGGGSGNDDDSKKYVVDLCHALTEEVDSEPATVVLTNNGLVSRMTDSGDVSWTCNLDELVPSDAAGGWFDVSYVDPELVCLSKRGAIVTVSPTTGEAELVGVFDYGLEAAAWSPDGEVLLMVTSAADDEDETKTKSVLMSMNSQFEVLAEITIASYLPSSDPESVAARVSVAWRPDGSLCAMSSVDAADKTRNVRIYKRETLELHAIGRSEDASGTLVKNLQDSGVAWASAGCSQLLTAVQRKGKKTQQVVFFESNGLRHREIVLREAPTTAVTSLTFNVNSDLLAVVLREEGGTDKIQLWHRCNYHWYMKREIRYPGQRVERIKFNEEKSSEFYVLLRDLEWREYEVRWDPSTTLIVEGRCPAFVIDGCSLNITPLDRALIPPPMSMNNVSLDYPISDVCFCLGGYLPGSMLVRLSNGNLVFLSDGEGNGTGTPDAKKLIWGDVKDIDVMLLRSFLVVGSESGQLRVVATVSAHFNQECEKLVEINIADVDSPEPTAYVCDIYTLENRVLRMVNWSDSPNGCLLELQDGSLLEYEHSENGGSVLPSDAEPLLEPCPWICGIRDASPYTSTQDHEEHSKLVFGLSTRSRLYFHDMMLTDSASSFFLSVSHEFLCYATSGSRCQLRFLPLKEINSFDPLMGMDQNHILEGYEPRDVERGARLVAILPSQPMAILQIPRGNLEGVYPRALVVRFAMTKITQREYGEAFSMMRKHKVDLNLLVDLDPWDFLEKGISTFFKQVEIIDHLNLFISGLQDWDITQSRFPIPQWLRLENMESKERSSFDFTTKVNQICSKARSTMLEMESQGEKPEGHFLLPVLSTFAKEDPPRVDEALNLIKDNALKQHTPTSKKPPLFSEKAQQSIHYLAFLAEYELLFETALGMYAYDLARAVARNSQMDPKVYLPLLKRLNGLPTFFARYEVDVRLKRHESALNNLFQSYSTAETIEGSDQAENDETPFGNKFDDCMSLIDEHKLHRRGLELFQSDTTKTRVIFVSLGESLLKDRKAEAALSVFLAAEPPCVEGAILAARSASDWRSYFALLEGEVGDETDASPEQQDIQKEKRRQLARDTADEIAAGASTDVTKTKQELHSNAARILLDYGDDLIGAIDMFLSAECWSEGYRVASLHSRKDLVKKCVDGAVSFAYTAMEELEEKTSTFVSTNTRYAEVLKLRKKNVFLEGPTTTEADETGSLFSVASTMSNMSLRSNTSGSSTGSNVSSVISVKSISTFSMTNDDSMNRHRSKFNKGKKKRKPKKHKKNKQKPGSEEELKGLVTTLQVNCADADYAGTIADTIQFLIFVQQLALATEVFKSYNAMRDAIEKSQTERIEATTKEKVEAEHISRLEGEQHDDNHVLVELPVEKVIDELTCVEIPESLRDFFSYTF
jgi:elongator complex protein 1